MSDEERALLAAIIAEPEEDTPRLAYADWLDEHATSDSQRARAELIRLQIKASAARVEAFVKGSSEYENALNVVLDLRPREIQMLATWGHAWFADAFPWIKELTEVTFVRLWGNVRRGFVWSHDATAEEWVLHGDNAVTRQPVQRVRLTTMPFNMTGHRYAGVVTTHVAVGDSMMQMGTGSTMQRAIVNAMSARWPGITFELPV